MSRRTQMTSSAESARNFIQQLSALADRLAQHNVVVASLHGDWASFGSWTLQAQKGGEADAYARALRDEQWLTPGPDVLRIAWDGRERLLTIESAPTPPLSSPGPWTREEDKVFEHRDAALHFVEEHLGRWVRGDA